MESQEKRVEAKEKIVFGALIVAGGTFLSRILGFVRDILFANILGATLVADAFYVAYRIPNLLRELFAEGSMSAGFIPVFTEYLTKRSKSEAAVFVRAVFTALCGVLLAIVGIGILFAPYILMLIAPGFIERPDQFHLATMLTRIMFPFLLFISFSALTMGILNSMHRFGPPALSPALFNVVMILFILFPFYTEPVFSAAMGVVAGGLFQWLMQMPAVRKEGFPLSFQRPIFPLNPGLIQMARLLVPATLSLSVTQVNILVNTIVASGLSEGAVSYLYYAMRLIHFPLGIFGVALSTALLPSLSVHVARADHTSLRDHFSFGLRLIFFITAPAMLGLILLRVPIVHLLFEHGVFDRADTIGVAQAVLYYSVGLWAFAGVRVVVPVFYALQDTKTPFFIAIFAMGLNVILCFSLVTGLQHGGLALATSLSAIFNFFALIFLLRKKIGQIGSARIALSHAKVILASLCMAPVTAWIASFPLWNTTGNLVTKGFLLSFAIVSAILIYFFVQALLQSEELIFLKTMLKTRLNRRK
jgi:putative peptidoglycan lipid II flippase